MNVSPLYPPSLTMKWCLAWAASATAWTGCATPTSHTGSATTSPAIVQAPVPGSAQAAGPAPRQRSQSIARPVDPPAIAQVGYVGDLNTNCVACGTHAAAAGNCAACLGNSGATACYPQTGVLDGTVPYEPYGIDPQEFICDGGDQWPKAKLRQNDTIAGLQTEDTVVHYTTAVGDIEFQASNRVCVYAPRFAAVRRITGVVSGEYAIGASGLERPVGPVRAQLNQPGLVVSEAAPLGHAEITQNPDAMRDRNRGVRIEGDLAPIQTEDILALVAGIRNLPVIGIDESQQVLLQRANLAAIAWTIDESVEAIIQGVAPPELTRDATARGFTQYDFGQARLRIGKFADAHAAQPGDTVTFLLRVDNVGDAAVTDVTVADNLTTRLEYIPESQKVDRPARFEVAANDADSVRLQWTLAGELKVGESAVIEFKCRVR